jgi:hypothetical protein
VQLQWGSRHFQGGGKSDHLQHSPEGDHFPTDAREHFVGTQLHELTLTNTKTIHPVRRNPQSYTAKTLKFCSSCIARSNPLVPRTRIEPRHKHENFIAQHLFRIHAVGVDDGALRGHVPCCALSLDLRNIPDETAQPLCRKGALVSKSFRPLLTILGPDPRPFYSFVLDNRIESNHEFNCPDPTILVTRFKSPLEP